MEKTKIAMHLEEESKPIKKMCEKLMDSINHELDKGIENVDTKELGEAIDMVKDLYEAKKEMYEACYYKQIMEAMEEHDFEDAEEIEDEGRKGYRGQRRDSRGRYMSNRGRRGYESYMMPDMDYDEMERMRDMDRMSYGRMGYSGSGSSGGSSMGSSSSMGGSQSSGSMGSQSGSRGYSESRYDRARRGYEETKLMHNSGSAEDKQLTMKEAEKMINVIFDELEESLSDAPKEVKDMIKNKGMAKLQKMN